MKGYSRFDYSPYYPLDEQDLSSAPYIAALRPFSGGIEIEWYDTGSGGPYSLQITSPDDQTAEFPVSTPSARVDFLKNGVLYRIRIVDTAAPDRRSALRLAKAGATIGVPVNYLHPEDSCYSFSGNSLCSPGIVRLKSGSLLVSMDIYKGRSGQNLTKIFRSDDGGEHWYYITDLFPCFWGKLFEHRNALYMLAMTTEYGHVVLSKSEDEGRSWSDFVHLLPGSGNRDCGGPHKAPLNILSHGGRLWTAVDFGTWEKYGHHSAVLSADETADLMCADSWTLSNLVPYNPAWPGAAKGECKGCLEGNMIVLPDGTLCNLLRYQTHTCTPTHDRAVLMKVDPSQNGESCTFYKVIDFPGGLSKFSVVYDGVTETYFALVNEVKTPDHPMSRTVISLTASKNCEDWRVIREIQDFSHEDRSGGKIGVQYPDALIDGEDLIWVQRTAMNGSANFHDSNYITFHRLRDFRRSL